MRKTCKWALKFSKAQTGQTLMASDQTYYARFQAEQQLPLLHIYTWSQPTLSLGRYQKRDPELEQRALKLNIPMVRRPTGGQGILHSQDLTWSLTGKFADASVLAAYQTWAQLHTKALQQMGIRADMGQEARAYRQEPSCFQVLNAGDIYVVNKGQKGKFIGAAQLRRRGALLQQQMLYLTLPERLLEAVFGNVPPMFALNQMQAVTTQRNGASLSPESKQAALNLLTDNQQGQHFIAALISVYSDFFQSEPELRD